MFGIENPGRLGRSAQHGDVAGEHAAGDGGHAAHHHGQQFRLGHAGDVGAHHQRRLGLADEHVRRHRQRFRAADAHHLEHDPGHALHDLLHEAQVVEHAHQRGEEDDGRQHLEGEDEAQV